MPAGKLTVFRTVFSAVWVSFSSCKVMAARCSIGVALVFMEVISLAIFSSGIVRLLSGVNFCMSLSSWMEYAEFSALLEACEISTSGLS